MRALERHLVPVMPLSEVVVYPRLVVPLYIFEPRYVRMLDAVLDSHGLIALAVLKTEPETDRSAEPPVYSVATVGGIARYERHGDGTSDVWLLGHCRAHIVEWEHAETRPEGYRRALLAALDERPPPSAVRGDRLRERLVGVLRDLTRGRHEEPDVRELFELFARERDIGYLVDVLGHNFLESTDGRRTVLEEVDVERRADRLFEALAK